MKRIVKIGEFEIEVQEGVNNTPCLFCSYVDGICDTIKNPIDPNNSKTSFHDFCQNYLGYREYPTTGSLDQLKKLPLTNAVKEYCKSYCISECLPVCPLYQFKTE